MATSHRSESHPSTHTRTVRTVSLIGNSRPLRYTHPSVYPESLDRSRVCFFNHAAAPCAVQMPGKGVQQRPVSVDYLVDIKTCPINRDLLFARSYAIRWGGRLNAHVEERERERRKEVRAALLHRINWFLSMGNSGGGGVMLDDAVIHCSRYAAAGHLRALCRVTFVSRSSRGFSSFPLLFFVPRSPMGVCSPVRNHVE
ncbi:unnamed protein product [Periconia digitata]|uniref:Uncharacterized protein n=1 Tax=Periconia digitata TaxID=1303443 RepID=A0A9W4XLA7_9PLEO|nr:unnamed protein product [Periconia digitata]